VHKLHESQIQEDKEGLKSSKNKAFESLEAFSPQFTFIFASAPASTVMEKSSLT